MRELAEIIETGPDPERDDVLRWRRVDLKRVIEERFGVAYVERSISRLLTALDHVHISARPQHPAQSLKAWQRSKNFPHTLRTHLAGVARGKAIEIWFQDEARLGQKNGRVRH